MPSATFFNLPEEKRQKLLSAAQLEFSRVPYDQASINKIIQTAGIPRGSFYMYFTDKEDLFHHLMSVYRRQLIRYICDTLDLHGGDLFTAFLTLYDQFSRELTAVECEKTLPSRVMAILHLNTSLRPDLLFRPGDDCSLSALIRPHINFHQLSLQQDSDLSDILSILSWITASSLAELSASDPGSVQTRRQHYQHTLHLLRRGMEAPLSPTFDPEEPL